MFLEKICAPALIYIIFSLIQIILDITNGDYNEAFMKLWVGLVFTLMLNFLCEKGLGLVSWMLVFVPFILMSTVVGILLLIFGLSPKGGRINIPNNEEIVDIEEDVRKKNEIELEKQMLLNKIKELEGVNLEDGSKMLEKPKIQDPLEEYVKSCNILKTRDVSPSVINACGSILKEYENKINEPATNQTKTDVIK
jgi:hypothetical protein